MVLFLHGMLPLADFNEDNALDYADLDRVVSRLTGNQGQLTRGEIDQLVDSVSETICYTNFIIISLVA